VAAVLTKQFHNFLTPILRSQLHRGFGGVVSGIHISLVGEERCDYLAEAFPFVPPFRYQNVTAYRRSCPSHLHSAFRPESIFNSLQSIDVMKTIAYDLLMLGEEIGHNL